MIPLLPNEKKVWNKGEFKNVFYLKISPISPLKFDKMCDLIAERTTLSSNEVGFVLGEIKDMIIENASIGRGVDCGPLGVFVPSLSAKAVEDEKDLNLKTVRKINIVFKPSLKIKKAFKDFTMRIKRDYK